MNNLDLNDDPVINDLINLHAAWLTAEESDPLNVLEYCTEDIEFHTPTQIIIGRNAVKRWLHKQAPPEEIISITIMDRSISYLRSLASLHARFQTRMKADKGEIVVTGQHFWTLKLMSGHWKVDKISWKMDE